MGLVVFYDVTCADCGLRSGAAAKSPTQARHHSNGIGWSRPIEDGIRKDYCPACWEKRRRARAEQKTMEAASAVPEHHDQPG